MNFITIKPNSVNINNIVEDNKGMFSIQRKDDLVIIHAKSVGLQFSGKVSEFNCGGQVFTDINDLHNWLSTNLFYSGGGSGEGLQKATLADVIEGTNNVKYITPTIENQYATYIVESLLHVNTTLEPLTLAELTNQYPNVPLRSEVDAPNILTKYTKLAENRWQIIPYAIAE